MAAVTYTWPPSSIFGSWLSNQHWASSKLSYSFPSGSDSYSYAAGSLQSLSGVQKSAVRQVLKEVSGFTRLEFIEVPETDISSGTLRFVRDSLVDGAYAYTPRGWESGGDAFFGSKAADPHVGNEAYALFLHETGHTLGLLHGNESPGFRNSGLDSQEYTVVTYSDYVGDPKPLSFDTAQGSWPQSYMQLDIAALQFLFGANYARRGEIWSGNTTYAFNPTNGEMSINGVGQGIPVENRIFRTIWDGDGTDTYDLRAYRTDVRIDLGPGQWSTFSRGQLADLNDKGGSPRFLAEGNLANARLVKGDTRALVENATGGSGNDVLIGNQADNVLRGGDGHDRFIARAGNDTLFGGNGNDVFWTGSGRDKAQGGSGNDTLNGGSGNNELSGGSGGDHLIGWAGADRLVGGDGNDQLEGGNGKDWLNGNRGRDAIKGGSGNDRIWGEAAQDWLSGGEGADELRGGADNDVLIGNAGADRLHGGSGADVFRFLGAGDSRGWWARDHILDFARGTDKIDLSRLAGPKIKFLSWGTFDGNGPSAITRKIGADLALSVDVDGDRLSDFQILVRDVPALSEGDFIL